MEWTREQRAVLDHPLDAHAVVRAVPGAGKTTTLVGRVLRLLERGVAPERVRVVMFNKAIQETFKSRLAAHGVEDVRVTTFDALGLEVVRAAERRGLTTRRIQIAADGARELSRRVWADYREHFEGPEDIADAVAFWKAHLVPPGRARYPSEPALVEAYARWEALRVDGDEARVTFEDMVYTAVGVLRQYPRLLGPVDHVLVDEFQDVNPGRVELIRLLAHDATSVMAVGDEDQGVNEWCGAHPRYFSDFDRYFPWIPTRLYVLSRSFRFGRTLAIAANNLIGHNVERQAVTVRGGGAAEGGIYTIADVAAAVRSLLAEGLSPADVAVLYRGRPQAVGAIAALAAAAVPVHTDDVELLRRGKGPELALAYLRHATSDAPVRFEDVWPIVHAPDRYIQREAFGWQVQRLGARGLRAVLADRGLAAALGQNPGAIRSLAELHATLVAMGRAGTAGRALDVLVANVDVEAQLRGRLRSERDQELAVAGFHAVHALLSGLGVAPADAADALATLDATRGQPPERCVWASTIHKAKGLEWRAVVLPGLGEGACPAEQRGHVPGTVEEPDGVAQSPWIEQERRIFYVGFTRAIERALLQVPGEAPSRFVAELLGRPLPGGGARRGAAAGVPGGVAGGGAPRPKKKGPKVPKGPKPR